MRRLSTVVVLGLIFVGGVLFGEYVSFDMPGISVGGNGMGEVEPAAEPAEEDLVEAEPGAAEDFRIELREDRIYQNGQEMTMDELDALLARAKAQSAIIMVEYDPGSVSGSFVDQMLDILSAAEVQYVGISR